MEVPCDPWRPADHGNVPSVLRWETGIRHHDWQGLRWRQGESTVSYRVHHHMSPISWVNPLTSSSFLFLNIISFFLRSDLCGCWGIHLRLGQIDPYHPPPKPSNFTPRPSKKTPKGLLGPKRALVTTTPKTNREINVKNSQELSWCLTVWLSSIF